MKEVTSFSVWIEETPVIDVLETTSFPIENVEFPTVTLCPASPNSDRWGATIKFLDYLNVAGCSQNKSNCN